MARTAQQRFTGKEFFRLPDPPPGQRYELIDGELVVTPERGRRSWSRASIRRTG